MAELPASTEVLIAGAGPTGLTLALTLRSQGIDCIVVDPEPAPVIESRAVAMHAGSLERLDVLGVADRLVDAGVVVGLTEIHSRGRIVARNDWTRLPSRFPMLLSIAQRDTESVLAAALADAGDILHRGWAVEDFSADHDAVRVEVTANGAAKTVTARFLAGCDGAHSQVRKRLGIGFGGTRYPETFLLADGEVSGLPRPDFSAFFLGDDGPLVVAALTGSVTRVGAVVHEGFEPTPSAITEVLMRRTDGRLTLGPIEWSSLFRTHRRLVDRMRVGRVILAGDAAHVHSPAGGQGMNLGIRDAFDLGHRLASHLGHHVPMNTLDDYESLRRAEAARVLKTTDRLARFLTATGPRRRVADAVMKLGSTLGRLSDRIMIETSGIENPWPPGAVRPAPMAETAASA